jgi:hypothetical protein
MHMIGKQRHRGDPKQSISCDSRGLGSRWRPAPRTLRLAPCCLSQGGAAPGSGGGGDAPRLAGACACAGAWEIACPGASGELGVFRGPYPPSRSPPCGGACDGCASSSGAVCGGAVCGGGGACPGPALAAGVWRTVACAAGLPGPSADWRAGGGSLAPLAPACNPESPAFAGDALGARLVVPGVVQPP